jgi:hypothetical protein
MSVQPLGIGQVIARCTPTHGIASVDARHPTGKSLVSLDAALLGDVPSITGPTAGRCASRLLYSLVPLLSGNCEKWGPPGWRGAGLGHEGTSRWVSAIRFMDDALFKCLIYCLFTPCPFSRRLCVLRSSLPFVFLSYVYWTPGKGET